MTLERPRTIGKEFVNLQLLLVLRQLYPVDVSTYNMKRSGSLDNDNAKL